MIELTFTLVFSLLFPIAMIILGTVWMLRPPRNRFGVSGFKTERARASVESWVFAHHHFGKLLVPFGVVLLAVSLATVLLVPGNKFVLLNVLVIVQLCVFLTIAGKTELAIRKHFDASGVPLHR